MVKSLKLHVFYKVAVNSELANTEWLLWEETQGKFLRVSGPNILVNWSVHNHVLCALLLKDTLFNMYCWSINIELTVNSTITHAKWSFSSVQSLSHVWLFPTPWKAALQASLSISSSRRLLKLMSINSVMPSNYLILCLPLLLLLSILPSMRVLPSHD